MPPSSSSSLSHPPTRTSCRTNKVSRYIHPRFSYILLLYLKETAIKRIKDAHKHIRKYVNLFYHLLSLLQFHSFSIKIQEEINKTHLQISSISYNFAPVLEEFVMDCVSCLKVLLMKNDGFLLFGCFNLFGCFKQLVNVLVLFLLFRMGFKFLKFSCSIWGLLSEPKNGFCSRIGFNGKCNSKLSSCKCELLKLLWNSIPPMTEKLEETKKNVVNSNSDTNEDSEESDSDDEHEVLDVMTLRKLVKKERAKANAARLELEKERMASSSAAEEAMAMILRLQNEKSLIELEANHYRRLAEEKQQHDQEVIQSLQWIVMKHDSEMSVLEERLRICRQKLKIYMKGDDEGDHFEGFDEFLGFSNANFEDDLYL